MIQPSTSATHRLADLARVLDAVRFELLGAASGRRCRTAVTAVLPVAVRLRQVPRTRSFADDHFLNLALRTRSLNSL